MNRKDLTKQIVEMVGASDLSASERLAALSEAQAQLRKFHAPVSPRGLQKKKFAGPLNRPGGKFMGKERRAVKE